MLQVFQSTAQTMTMRADNPGEWIVHCHFGGHAVEGMEATYTILPCTGPQCPLSTAQQGR